MKQTILNPERNEFFEFVVYNIESRHNYKWVTWHRKKLQSTQSGRSYTNMLLIISSQWQTLNWSWVFVTDNVSMFSLFQCPRMWVCSQLRFNWNSENILTFWDTHRRSLFSLFLFDEVWLFADFVTTNYTHRNKLDSTQSEMSFMILLFIISSHWQTGLGTQKQTTLNPEWNEFLVFRICVDSIEPRHTHKRVTSHRKKLHSTRNGMSFLSLLLIISRAGLASWCLTTIFSRKMTLLAPTLSGLRMWKTRHIRCRHCESTKVDGWCWNRMMVFCLLVCVRDIWLIRMCDGMCSCVAHSYVSNDSLMVLE